MSERTLLGILPYSNLWSDAKRALESQIRANAASQSTSQELFKKCDATNTAAGVRTKTAPGVYGGKER